MVSSTQPGIPCQFPAGILQSTQIIPMLHQGKLLQCISANSEKVSLSPKAMRPLARPERLDLETEQMPGDLRQEAAKQEGEGFRVSVPGETGDCRRGRAGLACCFLPPQERRVGTNSSHHCLVPGGPNLQHHKGRRGWKRFFQTLRYPLPSALTSLPPTAPRRW